MKLFAIRRITTDLYLGTARPWERHVAYARKFSTAADLVGYIRDLEVRGILFLEPVPVDINALEASARRIATRFLNRVSIAEMTPSVNGHVETMEVAS